MKKVVLIIFNIYNIYIIYFYQLNLVKEKHEKIYIYIF